MKSRTRRAVMCADDQFYDVVVERCSDCADVCLLPADQLTFCRINCPDYYRKYKSADNKAPSDPPDAAAAAVISEHSASSPPPAAGHTVDRLIDKPLFWTSIGSIVIALLATVAIIVLCVVRWRAAGRRCRQSGRGARAGELPGTAGQQYRQNLLTSGDRRMIDNRMKIETVDEQNYTLAIKENNLNKQQCRNHQTTMMSQNNGVYCCGAAPRRPADSLQSLSTTISLRSDDEGGRRLSRDPIISGLCRTEHLLIESCCAGAEKTLPPCVRSNAGPYTSPIDEESEAPLKPTKRSPLSTSVDEVTSKECTPWSAETDVKRLSDDDNNDDVIDQLCPSRDVSLDLYTLTTTLPLVKLQVPGDRLQQADSEYTCTELAINLRSDVGYRSAEMTL